MCCIVQIFAKIYPANVAGCGDVLICLLHYIKFLEDCQFYWDMLMTSNREDVY